MAQTIIQTPEKLSSFNDAQLYVVSESNVTANYTYKFRVDLLDPVTLNSSVNLGVYSLPPDPTNKGIFNSMDIVKQGYKTDKVFTNFTGLRQNYYQILPYAVLVGYETDLNLNFLSIGTDTYNGQTVVKLLFLAIGTPTASVSVGDEITIDKTQKQYNPQYDGRCKVVAKTASTITTNITYGTAPPVGTFESGKITRLMRMPSSVQPSDVRYAINAVVEYGEINKFNHSAQNTRALEDYDGYKSILPDQDEVTTIYTGNWLPNLSATASWALYDKNMNIITTFTVPLLTATNGSLPSFNLQTGTNVITTFAPSVDINDVYFYIIGLPYFDVIKRKIDKRCYDDVIRLQYINTLGGWSFWNFPVTKKTKTTTIEKVEYQNMLGYNYNIGDREIMTYGLKSKTEYEINSDWISEADYNYLSQLKFSPEVYIIEPETNYQYPIIVTDTTHDWKSVKNDKLFNFIMKYKMAYNDRVQNP